MLFPAPFSLGARLLARYRHVALEYETPELAKAHRDGTLPLGKLPVLELPDGERYKNEPGRAVVLTDFEASPDMPADNPSLFELGLVLVRLLPAERVARGFGREGDDAGWPRCHAGRIVDPEHGNCINPMAAAIRLADRVSTVSATYAEEICRPSDTSTGFIGGEGLERLLAEARDGGRLVGILNGCEYDRPKARRPGWMRLLAMLEAQLHDWQQRDPDNEAHMLARQRISAFPKRRPLHLLTSIGRLVAQKATLLLLDAEKGASPLQALSETLGRSSVIVILGSGEPLFEKRMLEVAHRCPNVLFLNGYSELLSDPLYAAGDLFLMPSSFEPCGISQMLAMRSGQPCVVHGVGGLRDTIEDGVTGFMFGGETSREQADNFTATTLAALEQRAADPAGPGPAARAREDPQADPEPAADRGTHGQCADLDRGLPV